MSNNKKIIRAVTVSISCMFIREIMKDMREKGYEMIALSSPGPEMDEIREDGFETIEVPMERHISPLKDIRALWSLICIFYKEKPVMVHSMTPKAGLLCMIAACLTRVPVRVHTFTGLVWPTTKGLKRRILMFTDWLTSACATHIIPEGEGVKNDLLSHGITRKPIKVLGYGNVKGVDMERYSVDGLKSRIESYPSEERAHLKAILDRHSQKEFVFLFVGRIVGDKGINELVEAFVRLNNQYPNSRLLLVGWLEHELDPVSDVTLQTIENHPKIESVGTKMGDELLAYYAAADCFVFPSYREGFPNTPLEAGAMGLPCIVTDINGAREIISFNSTSSSVERGNRGPGNVGKLSIRDNGIVIPPRDSDYLYEAMWRMVNDDKMRERMAANARKMIADRFEQGFVRKCLYDFYEEILPNN